MASTPHVSKLMFNATLQLCGYKVSPNVRCLPDYMATLSQVAGGSLEQARQDGFYCFGEGTNRQGAIEPLAGGDDFIESGPRIERLHKGYKLLAAQYGNAELRILRISALAIEALWSHQPAAPAKDVFIPYFSSVKAITSLSSFDAPTLLALLQPLAQQKLVRVGVIQPF